MARRGAAKKTDEPSEPVSTSIKIFLAYDGEPLYANYAEISSAQHEFQIAFALTPTKPNVDQVEQAKSGTVAINALVQILLPPTIIPGLIKALTTTKEQHESVFGPIKELGS